MTGWRRWLALGVLAIAMVGAGWLGWRTFGPKPPAEASISTEVPDLDQGAPAESVEAVDTGAHVDETGTTPMAQRVAVVGLLNKRNGESRELTMRPGQALRVGDAIVRLRACDRTAPWEPEPLTGSFVQLDVRGADTHWRRVFSGWLYKERPSLNVVENAVYDVWTKSCTMSFPATGPDTTTLAAPAPAGRSSAKKSPAGDDSEAPADEPTTPASAPDSNAT